MPLNSKSITTASCFAGLLLRSRYVVAIYEVNNDVVIKDTRRMFAALGVAAQFKINGHTTSVKCVAYINMSKNPNIDLQFCDVYVTVSPELAAELGVPEADHIKELTLGYALSLELYPQIAKRLSRITNEADVIGNGSGADDFTNLTETIKSKIREKVSKQFK
jgi:hypothetical protein